MEHLELLISFLLAWLTALSGVALGGWLVFRTKRESYEGSLFGAQPKGDAFNISDGIEMIEPVRSSAGIPVLPKSTEDASERFLKQFEQKIMGATS